MACIVRLCEGSSVHMFVIVAPAYSARSGGIMVLHDLCEALNRCGYRAGMVFLHGGNATEQNYSYAVSSHPSLYRDGGDYYYFHDEQEAQHAIANGTVVYPDLITGNPLGARRVVRYVLNFNESEFPGDFVLSFSGIYSKYTDHVLFKPFHHPAFCDHGAVYWRDRTLDITYIGKGPSFIECHRINNTLLIERDYPRDKEQLALLLRHCRFFFTWDCVSATNIDALMCGAVPVLLHDKQISRDQINRMEIGSFPQLELPSIQDLPNGLRYDERLVDTDIEIFKTNYHRLLESWDARVEAFARAYLGTGA
jgi:hypothetical protein